MRSLKVFLPMFMAVFWTYACVCMRFDTLPPPPDNQWKSVPQPEFDSDGCCLKGEPEFDFGPLEEPNDTIDLKKGAHIITFEDILNPIFGWEIDHYELYNQWGDVIANIPPNDHHRYVVHGVPKGCYRLRAIGKTSHSNVTSIPSNEGCTPGLKPGRTWS